MILRGGAYVPKVSLYLSQWPLLQDWTTESRSRQRPMMYVYSLHHAI
jgi:hypothetical protein